MAKWNLNTKAKPRYRQLIKAKHAILILSLLDGTKNIHKSKLSKEIEMETYYVVLPQTEQKQERNG